MRRIIIDTNFLMVPWQFRVDIFSEIRRICDFNYELFIFEQTISELKNIMEKSSGKGKKAAQFALKLIKLTNIQIIESEKKDVDSLILKNADVSDIIATQDTHLKTELIKKKISVIILRQKKYLMLIERRY